MTQFLPQLLGGLLIGTAAVAMMGLLGRVTGISGMFWNMVSAPKTASWSVLFMLGLLLGTSLLHQLSGLPTPEPSSAGLPMALAAGFLVGLGTRLGSGCTSGHGVCGISRLSPRSLVATLTFMAAGFATVAVIRQLLGG